MADVTPTISPVLGGSSNKPSRDVVKAEREAAKEAKRVAKAAAAAKKANSSSAAAGQVGAVTNPAAGPSQSAPKKSIQQHTPGVGKKQQEKAAATTIPAGDVAENQSAKQKPTTDLSTSIRPSTPSVLGGVSLFGNVSTSAHPKELTKQVIAASYRSQIHPSVLKLAQHLSNFTIVGADARAIAVLKVLRDFVVDYRLSSGAVFSRDLVTKLGPQIGFLVNARPLGASVGHAIRYLKYEISVTPVELNEDEVSLTLPWKGGKELIILFANRPRSEFCPESIILFEIVSPMQLESLLTIWQQERLKTEMLFLLLQGAA